MQVCRDPCFFSTKKNPALAGGDEVRKGSIINPLEEECLEVTGTVIWLVRR